MSSPKDINAIANWDWIDRRLEAARAFIPSDEELDALCNEEQAAYERHLDDIKAILEPHADALNIRGFTTALQINAKGLKYSYSFPGFYGPAGFESSFHPAGRLVVARLYPGATKASRPNDLSLNTFLGRDFAIDRFRRFVEQDLIDFLAAENQILSEDNRNWLRSKTEKSFAVQTMDLESKLTRMYSFDTGTGEQRRQRGRDFEDFLGHLIKKEGSTVRLRFRPSGEEIDGSFDLFGKIFLLEAKWHNTPLPASSIYQFRGKVDGKLVGTIGVFISMSGFSEEAVNALTTGKALNVLLMDRNDIKAAVGYSFTRVLKAKIRAAAEEGAVYYPFLSTDGEPVDDEGLGETKGELILLGEGPRLLDRLGPLAQRALNEAHIDVAVRCVATHSLVGAPRVANALSSFVSEETGLMLVVDDVGDSPDQILKIADELDRTATKLIVIPGSVEDWFSFDPEAGETLGAAIKSFDLDRLSTQHAAARKFLSEVVRLAEKIKSAL